MLIHHYVYRYYDNIVPKDYDGPEIVLILKPTIKPKALVFAQITNKNPNYEKIYIAKEKYRHEIERKTTKLLNIYYLTEKSQEEQLIRTIIEHPELYSLESLQEDVLKEDYYPLDEGRAIEIDEYEIDESDKTNEDEDEDKDEEYYIY